MKEKLKWEFDSLAIKDSSWSEWFSSFLWIPNNEGQIKALTEKYNQDLAKIETDAPNLYKIIDELVNKADTAEKPYTVNIISVKSVFNKVDSIIIDITKSSIDLNNHIIIIEDSGLFNILQNLAYQLYVAQEYTNASFSDSLVDLDKAKINYFDNIKNYLSNNSEELLKAFGITSSVADICEYLAYQGISEQKSTNEEVKVLEVTLTGVEAEMDAKEGEID